LTPGIPWRVRRLHRTHNITVRVKKIRMLVIPALNWIYPKVTMWIRRSWNYTHVARKLWNVSFNRKPWNVDIPRDRKDKGTHLTIIKWDSDDRYSDRMHPPLGEAFTVRDTFEVKVTHPQDDHQVRGYPHWADLSQLVIPVKETNPLIPQIFLG
jgi:hypothetical protein